MNNDKLRLNLQFFSEDNADGSVPNETAPEEVVEETVNEPVKPEDEKKFTQADLDRAIQDRLARDRKKRDDEAEQKRLEEQGEYKALLEKANEKIAELETQQKSQERSNTITSLLLAKGLSGEDVAKYAKYVNGSAETSEELESAVNEVYEDFIAAKQASIKDPSAGFGETKKPEPKGDDDFGREMFKRLGRK